MEYVHQWLEGKTPSAQVAAGDEWSCEAHSCSDTAWSIPCCAAVSASISVEGPLSAVGAPLCELGDDGTEGGSEESGAACTKEE